MAERARPTKPPLSRNEKIRDFALGVGAQFLLLALAGAVLTAYAVGSSRPGLAGTVPANLQATALLICSSLVGLLNVVAILVAVIRRPWIALGMAVWYAALFLLGLIAAVFTAVLCFGSLSSL